jgi:undecaprenyl-diphosphatase
MSVVPPEATLAAIAQATGVQALWWFMAGLAGWLATAGAAVLLAQRYLLRRSLDAAADNGRLRSLLLGLGLGFLLLLATACVFAMLANNMAADAPIGQFDLLLTAAIRAQSSAEALRFFAWITHFGDTATLTVLCIGGAAALGLLRRPLLALGLVAAIGGNSLLNPALKAIFERARPLHDGLAFNGWSFPSGHTSGSVVAYGMLAYVALRMLPGRWHLPMILLAAAIAFSTGFSRIYLQAHYLSDVVAGFASGTAWLVVCIGSLELARFYGEHRRQR